MIVKSVQSKNPCQSVIQTNYDIVKAHGGKLTLESIENHSATFKITLPI